MVKNGSDRVTTREFYEMQKEISAKVDKYHKEVSVAIAGNNVRLDNHKERLDKIETRRDKLWDLINSIGVGVALIISGFTRD